jgi:hypothetical protein
MTAATRTQAMLAARAQASRDKRQQVLTAVQALEAAGTPVTATAVAAAAGVSTWLVYADGVREHVEAARRRQADREPGPATAAPGRGEPVSQASLRTDLVAARDEIRRLRAERDKLRARFRLQLGAEIEGPDRAELVARVASLEAASRQLAAERDARAAEASHAQRRIRELEDELTAARESLRRAIRQANR